MYGRPFITKEDSIMKKKILGLMMAITMTASFVACGATESAAPAAKEETTETAEAEEAPAEEAEAPAEGEVSAALQNYIDNGFRIGADPFAPYIYQDESGAWVGVDYDILTAVLGELGVTNIEVKPTAYESVILELNNDNVDCTCDGMYITEARMQQGVYFSDVIYYENDCVLIAADSDIAAEADLADKKLAVTSGSVAADLAEAMVAEGKVGSLDYYTSNDLTFAAVNSGQADAVLCDCFAAAPTMADDSNLSLKYLDSYTPQLEDAVAGFGFRAADKEFVAEFNTVLNAMKDDGRLQAIFEKWNMSAAVFCDSASGHTVNLAE